LSDQAPAGKSGGAFSMGFFVSILFEENGDGTNKESPETPAFFVDLNLDQIVEAVTAGREEYNLKPFFYTPLKTVDSIKYRQEIMRELEQNELFEQIESFAKKMRTMRKYLIQADKLYYKYQRERWFLDAVELYCDAVICLADDLSIDDLKSEGFLSFREYMKSYIKSDRFTSLLDQTKKLKADLLAIQYCMLIHDSCITVRKSEFEVDYSADVEKTFEKFKQGAVKDFRVEFPDYPEMNHVEAGVLDLVAKLYPETFLTLDGYCVENARYQDETIEVFDREIQFYLAYLTYIARFKRAGLKFSYPRVSNTRKEVYNFDGFDLALANRLITDNSSGSPVVCNDFHLKGRERIIVVSGPNQGGKTTFARTFGQLHYLAALGCPVPGREARLFLFDNLFTHFEKEENIGNLRGKLEDDLVRIHNILEKATSSSIIIMNEIFTSTTLSDALYLGKEIMSEILESDLLCVCVTFIDELASLGEKTVSMVSTVDPDNPAQRTFKVVRRPADGLAYALSIAEKYRVTYHSLKERIEA
jgi:DNA mismatch repair protein MutS